ncbi:MAG: sulfatase-like hydrolase/transferase, partial [Rhodospirillaceae bacterium]|nr:sulfatase-like hydrolase/transferase [Rhodospirillaceae bacterium]
MKAIMLMFDTLCSRFLPPYGNTWVHAPNFTRLASRTVTFDTSYVCSMPCIPARREMLSGRPNFLHRSWGPFEPFDDSLPKILSSNGIFTHLTTDHAHYFEDGGLTYHTQYDSWEFFRGQEGDPWIGQVADPEIPDDVLGNGGRFSQGLVRERLQAAFQPGSGGSSVPHRSLVRQDWVNRGYMTRESRQPQARMVKSGLEFIH